jgi:F0F1-type ATP synthase membrane subunit c/vacuolar-type H+-ATPase subunit K
LAATPGGGVTVTGGVTGAGAGLASSSLLQADSRTSAARPALVKKERIMQVLRL